MANETTLNGRYEYSAGIMGEVPSGLLFKDKDGTALVPADLKEEEFRRYVAQRFGPTFAGYCVYQIFNVGANTTVHLGLQDINTYLATPANRPQRVGTHVESGLDAANGIMQVVLMAVQHARGLKIPEESPNFS